MNDSNFCLNSVQYKAVKEVADAEMRSMEQMLSLLLEQGICFYFSDYWPQSGERPETGKLEDQLRQDAIKAIQN